MPHFTITGAQAQQFHADGYLIVPQIFDKAETDVLYKIAKADRDMDNAHARLDTQGNTSRLRVHQYAGDDYYSAIARSRRIVDAMQTLLGDEVYHFHHKMMVKEPRVGGAWEWHQDYGYWYVQQSCLWPNLASCMIAVDRASKGNGCLQVIKASHLCGRVEHGTAGEQVGADMGRVNAMLERLERIYVELEPGDGLFFHCNLMHRSDQNRSENPRWTLICCYNSKHNTPYCDNHTHPAYHRLEKLDDDAVLDVGQRQWEQMQATTGA